MATDDVTAALAYHKDRGEREVAAARDVVTRHSGEAIICLVAALEAVLKLADGWKAEAVKAEYRAERASERDDDTACAVLYARATALNQNARGLREAITRELTRKEGGDGS